MAKLEREATAKTKAAAKAAPAAADAAETGGDAGRQRRVRVSELNDSDLPIVLSIGKFPMHRRLPVVNTTNVDSHLMMGVPFIIRMGKKGFLKSVVSCLKCGGSISSFVGP